MLAEEKTCDMEAKHSCLLVVCFAVASLGQLTALLVQTGHLALCRSNSKCLRLDSCSMFDRSACV